ncbi:MAG: polynucleotide kinase-phosphatase [bacterium]|nr:polynucleotide kinase-phosphatase [bacterium]
MNLTLSELSLVVLIGPSGAGKSTFANAHFKPTEILSSDACRALVSDDQENQAATDDAFDVLHFIAAKRLSAGRLTVIDATNVQPRARKPLIDLARQYHCLPIAMVFDLPEKLCQSRNKNRTDRNIPGSAIHRQIQQLYRSRRSLKREGFHFIYTFSSPEDVEAATLERQPTWPNRQHESGPFDIIGDVHGCCDELEMLLEKLGYVWQIPENALYKRTYRHPEGRKAVFLGDLVDRGPRILDTCGLVQNMVLADTALCIPGNHDQKLVRKLQGRKVQITHGLDKTLAELNALSSEIRRPFQKQLIEFLYSLVSHYVFDHGQLVVSHAGMPSHMQGRASRKVREFALYGETTGETDEFGLPVRYNWAAEYRGKATVVYGHTPVPEPEWLNQTLNIDTGCVFGGKLTALRYPENELVEIPAKQTYAEPIRPLKPQAETTRTAQQQHDDILDIEDMMGQRRIETRLGPIVTIREENSIPALEVLSRFAIDPKWLIYLPPTMSPPQTSSHPNLLEHPAQVFEAYRKDGVQHLICEEKHMGSRAIIVVCRDETTARDRFGVTDGTTGVCYTRTGRHFFDHPEQQQACLRHIQNALTETRFWDAFETGWVCLDTELMPWSAKAQDLLQNQYAPVGAAAETTLNETHNTLQQARDRGLEIEALQAYYQERIDHIKRYRNAYRQYCWPVHTVDDLKLAPFHILATEGAVHTDKTHLWHLETIARFLGPKQGPFLHTTAYQTVDLSDPNAECSATTWWEDLTSQGKEGMVVKPQTFVSQNSRNRLIQPAVKCRGPEYLRIIYGPEYTSPKHLERLRQRNVSAKRSLAIREFALGIEALERFVNREPLRRVHECVFGVLALESEPIDPRL